MNTQKNESRWTRRQSGQAMMEYWPTFPIAVAIIIAAGAISQMLNGAFLSTADALNRSGMGTEVCNETVEDTDGPADVALNDHTIETCANVYDPETDTTTFCFTVTTGCSPSISHWTLGLPQAVAANIVDASEAYESWGTDPTTGVTGIKFDNGYECTEVVEEDDSNCNNGVGNGADCLPPGLENNGKDELDNDDGEGDAPGNPGNKGGSKNTALPVSEPRMLSRMGTQSVMQISMPATGDSRDIFMVLSGQYEWEPVPVAVKAGTETYTGTISAPAVEITEDATSGSTDIFDADNLHEGCQ